MVTLAIVTLTTESITSPQTLIPALYVFALAAFLGYQVISRVPPLLHTPLMSATNAISGISLVGSIVAAGAHYDLASTILGVTAVTCSTINVVGGFMITDRMLRMFKRKDTAVVKKTEKPEVANKDGKQA
ncbi:MAG: NAD(P) transhydrogenase subunit alpha [Pyrinomonadaceae bacterium]